MKLPPKYIGLTGLARSGKDSVRNVLCERFDYFSFALADPIREALQAMLDRTGISGIYEFMHGDEKETEMPGVGYSYRQLAQSLGTAWGREQLDPDFWTRICDLKLSDFSIFKKTEAFVLTVSEPTLNFVISDIRFNTEAEWLIAKGGTIWHISRAGAPAVNPHASESGIDPSLIDQYILNDGLLVDLPALVQTAMDAECQD